MRPAALALLALLLPATGHAAPGAVPGDSTRLVLEPCVASGIRARCGVLRVPEDRTRPSGRTLSLRVLVVPAEEGARAPDPVFFLAGGPGQAATASVGALARSSLADGRDLVLVDQRGTGGSSALSCRLGTPDDAAQAYLAGRIPEARLEACRRSWAADVRDFTTPAFVEDLDAVRRALGYERINLVAGSYGTRAAQVYARRHPDRVRTMVLRGVAPLQYRVPMPFAEASQAALDSLVASCRRSARCRGVHRDLAATLDRVRRELRRRPRTVEVRAGGGEAVPLTLDEGVLNGTVLVSLYYLPWAEQLPKLLAAADRGQWRPLARRAAQLATFFDRQIHLGLFMSVVCTEDFPRIAPGELADSGRGTFLGAAWARGVLAPCRSWPRKPLPEGYHRPVRSDVPTLLISGALDPVTPPEWAEVAARTLPRARHLVLPDTGHLPTWPGCVDGLVAAFVAAGTAEGLDAGCVDGLARRSP